MDPMNNNNGGTQTPTEPTQAPAEEPTTPEPSTPMGGMEEPKAPEAPAEEPKTEEPMAA